MLKIWDIVEQRFLQNLKIRFKSFEIQGKSIEFGNHSIYPGPKRTPLSLVDRQNENKKCFSMSDIIPATEHSEESDRYFQN